MDSKYVLNQYNAIKRFLSLNSITVIKQYEHGFAEDKLIKMISNSWNQLRFKSNPIGKNICITLVIDESPNSRFKVEYYEKKTKIILKSSLLKTIRYFKLFQ